ncbi:MAG: flavin reductase family protein [Acidimicrobiales bacterium]
MGSFDYVHTKGVLGHYATGVVVITASTVDGPVGFTCQTFGSLSIVSSLIFFAATTSSSSWARIRKVGVVGVNILGEEQEGLARQFAASGSDKFSGATWTSGPKGSPLLDGSLAFLEASIREVTHHADHDIVVAETTFASAQSGSALIYYRGGYHALA